MLQRGVLCESSVGWCSQEWNISAQRHTTVNSMQRVVPSKVDSVPTCLQTPVRSQLIVTIPFHSGHFNFKNFNSQYKVFKEVSNLKCCYVTIETSISLEIKNGSPNCICSAIILFALLA